MTRPILWTARPNEYVFRIEFQFVDVTGALLKAKTWELRQMPADPPRAILLQAPAKLASSTPAYEELGRNFYRITTKVTSLTGELTITNLLGFKPEDIQRQLAEFPVSVGLIIDQTGLQLSLHVTTTKTHE